MTSTSSSQSIQLRALRKTKTRLACHSPAILEQKFRYFHIVLSLCENTKQETYSYIY
jgi:hypothetical protein